MPNTYLDEILSGNQQRKISGRGGLTPEQITAAFEGDIAARYRAKLNESAEAAHEAATNRSLDIQADQVKGQKQAEIANLAITGLGVAAYTSPYAVSAYQAATAGVPAVAGTGAAYTAGGVTTAAGTQATITGASATSAVPAEVGMAAYAGPAAAGAGAGYVGGRIAQASPVGGEKDKGFWGGAAGGAATGAAIGSLAGGIGAVPGAIIGGIIGGVTGWATSGGCIIVTACTDPTCHEVEIARLYRDIFMDKDQLRGYYAIAEKVVPHLESSERLRKWTKKNLVDRLVDYGEYCLNLKRPLPRISSIIVSRTFLAACKLVGMVLPEYVRKNGEVY